MRERSSLSLSLSVFLSLSVLRSFSLSFSLFSPADLLQQRQHAPTHTASAGAAAAAGSTVPAVVNFALIVDDGNPKIVMIRDPNADEPSKPYWKLIGHKGQPHQARTHARNHRELTGSRAAGSRASGMIMPLFRVP